MNKRQTILKFSENPDTASSESVHRPSTLLTKYSSHPGPDNAAMLITCVNVLGFSKLVSETALLSFNICMF